MREAAVTGIRAWSPQSRREPVVRVGVILDEDAFARVEIVLPGKGYAVRRDGEPGPEAGATSGLVFTRGAAGVALAVDDGAQGTAAVWRVAPVEAVRLQAGEGLLVRGVVAGRGFHWQKNIDQTLAGAVEVWRGERGLVLVNELPLEHYLAGVITAEMSGACPLALLQAQCVVARSWLLAMAEPKHDDDPFDRCNDDCCQRYQGTGDLSAAALDAVRSTRGMALLDPVGRVLDANYAKSCGGISELPVNVWGIDKPGLSAVVDAPAAAPEHQFYPVTEANLAAYLDGDWLVGAAAYCSANVVPLDAIRQYLGRVDEVDDYFRWTVTHEHDELCALLKAKVGEMAAAAAVAGLRVVRRGVSGRAAVLEVDWCDSAGQAHTTVLDSEYRIREALHVRFLYSSAFAVRTERDSDGRLTRVTLRGAGWGHGVGMCQIGALGMALLGHDYEAIGQHYYPEARLERVYA